MGTPNLEKTKVSQKPHFNKPVYRHFFNLDFILSVIVPIIVFYALNHYYKPLTGTICVGAWCIGIIIIQFIRTRHIDIYASISVGFSLISLIGTLISRNPIYYMVSPVIENIIFSLIFFVSVLIRKPIIKTIAEYSMKTKFSKEVSEEPILKSSWSIITLLWGVAYIAKAALRITLLSFSSYSTYYAISSVYSNISDILLIMFSLWFVRWYKRRNIHKPSGTTRGTQ